MPDSLDDRLDAAFEEHADVVVASNNARFYAMLEKWAKDATPLSDILAVQPMQAPAGKVFYLDYCYNTKARPPVA
jgi:hypothetical protein